MTTPNPFTQRGAINAPEWFAGRWGELSLLFSSLEGRRPVFVTASPSIGKSSLLNHVIQSAAVNLEQFDLRAFYLDLAAARSDVEIYRVVIGALGGQGASFDALRAILAKADAPTLLCLDNAHVAFQADWGEALLDALVRLARARLLMLVVAQNGEPPMLSERVNIVRLGAFAPAEARLVADTYLEGTGVIFTPRNVQQLYRLSQGHPAYFQRAAYHLFEAKLLPGYNWVGAYLEEAKEQPIPGAPLSPMVFEGEQEEEMIAREAEVEGQPPMPTFPIYRLDEPSGALVYGLPVLLGALLLALSGSVLVGGGVALAGLAVVAGVRRFGASRGDSRGLNDG